MKEQWKPVPDACAYEFSNQGRLRRSKGGSGTWKGRLMNPSVIGRGYSYQAYTDDGKLKRMSVGKMLKEIWDMGLPEVGLKAWYANLLKKNHDENLESAPVKFKGTVKSSYQSSKETPASSRNCFDCGKPSGVNWWCDKCRNLRRGDPHDPYQHFPGDTYRVHHAGR